MKHLLTLMVFFPVLSQSLSIFISLSYYFPLILVEWCFELPELTPEIPLGWNIMAFSPFFLNLSLYIYISVLLFSSHSCQVMFQVAGAYTGDTIRMKHWHILMAFFPFYLIFLYIYNISLWLIFSPPILVKWCFKLPELTPEISLG